MRIKKIMNTAIYIKSHHTAQHVYTEKGLSHPPSLSLSDTQYCITSQLTLLNVNYKTLVQHNLQLKSKSN